MCIQQSRRYERTKYFFDKNTSGFSFHFKVTLLSVLVKKAATNEGISGRQNRIKTVQARGIATKSALDNYTLSENLTEM